MIELTPWRKVFVIVIVALAFAAGTTLGWYARGGELPVGVMPTTAMQMAAPLNTEAEPSATYEPATEPAPTSTAAPTVAQPTATLTPKEEWDIECPPGGPLADFAVKCREIIVDQTGEVARLYWVGECIPPQSLTLQKWDGNGPRVLSPEEWSFKFVPGTCNRPENRPSPNHLMIRSFAGPGNYQLDFGDNAGGEYSDSFRWDSAPPASVPTPSPAPTATPELVQSTTPLRGFAASVTEVLHDTPGDGAQWIGTVLYRSPVYIWECGSPLTYPEGTYLSLVSHEGDSGLKVGWIATTGYTDRHPCSYYTAPGVGALVRYLVAAGYGDEEDIRALPGLKYDPYAGVETDLED